MALAQRSLDQGRAGPRDCRLEARSASSGSTTPHQRNGWRRTALPDAMNCARCQDIRWVCEEHPDKPMEHDGCKGVGMPCPLCNPADRGKVPILPPAFEIDRG